MRIYFIVCLLLQTLPSALLTSSKTHGCLVTTPMIVDWFVNSVGRDDAGAFRIYHSDPTMKSSFTVDCAWSVTHLVPAVPSNP